MSGVVVAGMHLSGTTLVTRLLASGGWHPGESVLVDGRRDYLEDSSMVALHRAWLARCLPPGDGHRDWGLSDGGLPDLDRLVRAPRDVAEFAALRDDQHPRWVAKDPRATLFLDLWAEVPDAKFVLVYRNPWDVVDSGFRVQHGPFCERPSVVRDAWRTYNSALADFARREPARCRVVAAEAVVAEQAAVTELLSDFVGMEQRPPRGVVDPDRFVLRGDDHAVAALYRDLYPEHMEVLDDLDSLAALGRAPAVAPVDRRQPAAGGTLPEGTGVQVVIACRNDGDFLAEAVASVDEHMTGPVELTLVDDGSDDPETLRVMDVLRATGRHVVRTEGVRLGPARNVGAATSRTLGILPLDADNRLGAPLFDAVDLLRDDLADVVHGPWQVVGMVRSRVVPPDASFRSLLPTNTVDGCALVRRSLFDQLGGYDETLPYWEDWDLWLGALAAGARFRRLDGTTFTYLERPGSMKTGVWADRGRRDRTVTYLVGKYRDHLLPHLDLVLQELMTARGDLERRDERDRDRAPAEARRAEEVADLGRRLARAEVRLAVAEGGAGRMAASPTSGPDVSVVVLAHRSVGDLDACLRSLAVHDSVASFEVVVVANGASSEVEEVLSRHSWVRTVRSRANLGFAGGCNLGARRARGRRLLFLNDDAVVQRCWMDTLVHELDARPAAGVAASAVVSHDGTVLEVGGEFVGVGGADGPVTRPLLRGEPAAVLEHLVPLKVPYVSGCSMMVDAALFAELGGFDEAFYPAYYEDADLCRRVWAAGREVVTVPSSVVCHAESASTGAGERSAMFRVNEARFLSKWSTEPEPVPGHLPEPVPWVLLLDDFVPRPASGAGLSRARAAVEVLVSLGYAVVLHVRNPGLAVDDGLRRLGVRVVDDLSAVAAGPPPAFVVVSRPHNFDVAEEVATSWSGVPLVYDAEARFAARLESMLSVAGAADDVASVRTELAATEDLERRIARGADAVVTIAPEEADWFRSAGADAVHVVDPFPDRCDVAAVDVTERRRAVLTAGWMAGATGPNADGLRWFAEQVVPLFGAAGDGLVVDVTGADPPRALRAMSGSSLRFVGEVPDLDVLFASARLAVAPVRFGAGVKIKVVDALSRGVPVVTTPVGADGVPSKWHVGMVVAEGPEEFARAVASLAGDDDVWRSHHDALVEVCSAHRGDARAAWSAVLDAAQQSAVSRRSRP